MLEAVVRLITFSLPTSAFPPLAIGFFGLGTGYLIYGPQELFKYPGRSPKVDLGTGIWGIFMPGLMQLICGTYLFVGLVWFHSFSAPPLYAAALAFTAYGVHWFAIGINRMMGADPRANVGMTIAYTMISVLGIVVFAIAKDYPVMGLFIGLTCIYVTDFTACSNYKEVPATDGSGTVKLQRSPLGDLGEKGLGFSHLGTGLFLMYLTWASVLNLSNGWHLWI